jgi:hypothetical protein
MWSAKATSLTAVLLVLILAPAVPAQQFGPWSDPVHLDWGVNTDREEMNALFSKDGLTLFFWHRETTGPTVPFNLYVAHRSSVDAPWGAPILVGDIVGGGLFISRDGHRAYFQSTTESGDSDLYISRRRDQNDDFGWGPWENLGPTVNTTANEAQPSLYEDEATGLTFLYFTSNRAGNDDIYASVMQPDGTFGQPAAVAELNSPGFDRQMKVRRDGLECVFSSNREGSMLNPQGNRSNDIWVATRASTSEAWSTPVNFGAPINSGRTEGFPSYSFDGSQLYFHAAQREGNFGVGCPDSGTCYFDIWMVTREKLTGNADK